CFFTHTAFINIKASPKTASTIGIKIIFDFMFLSSKIKRFKSIKKNVMIKKYYVSFVTLIFSKNMIIRSNFYITPHSVQYHLITEIDVVSYESAKDSNSVTVLL
ncbi:MAG: hypothetical protein AAF934_10765, partial [Bacteroidota bacterium]